MRDTFNDQAFASMFAITAERTSLRMFSRNTISHVINSGYIHDINKHLLSFQSKFDFYFMISDALYDQNSAKKEDQDYLVELNKDFVQQIEETILMVKKADINK